MRFKSIRMYDVDAASQPPSFVRVFSIRIIFIGKGQAINVLWAFVLVDNQADAVCVYVCECCWGNCDLIRCWSLLRAQSSQIAIANFNTSNELCEPQFADSSLFMSFFFNFYQLTSVGQSQWHSIGVAFSTKLLNCPSSHLVRIARCAY